MKMASFICTANVNNNNSSGNNATVRGYNPLENRNITIKPPPVGDVLTIEKKNIGGFITYPQPAAAAVFIEPKEEAIDIVEHIKQETIEQQIETERPLLLNADVLADVVKDEPVDIEEYSLVDKENNVPLGKKEKLYEYDPNSFARNLTVKELVRLEFGIEHEQHKFVFTGVPFVNIRNVHKEEYEGMLVSKSKLEIKDKNLPKRKKKSTRKSKEKKSDVNVKEEPMDWEMTAEEEILKANKEWSKNNYRVIENLDPGSCQQSQPSSKPAALQTPSSRSDSPVMMGPGLNKERYEQHRPARNKFLPLPLQDNQIEEEAVDDLELESGGEDIENENNSDEDYDPQEDGYRSSKWSPDLSELNENLIHVEIEDNSNTGSDQITIKDELTADDVENTDDVKIVEIGDFKVETFGDYSKCPRCSKFIKSTFIIRHIKSHDNPPTFLKCPYKNCKVSFNRSNNMYRHLKVIHNDPSPYICCYKTCDQVKFSESKDLRDHIRSFHKSTVEREIEELENGKFQCTYPDCDKVYGKKQHLKEHIRKHTGEKKYACDVCGERFYVHGHMKRHLYSHTGIKPHACRWKCGAIFASYGGRMKHEKAQHSENPYKLECDICGRPFRFDRELDKHKMTHLAPSERVAYRCSFCGIIFDSIAHRERHEKRHQDKDDFHCEECNKYFKNEKNLRHHNKAHHEQNGEHVKKHQNAEKKIKKEPPKYKCHMCNIDIMFPLTALRRHLARKHSTNFKCEKEGCNKTFAQQYQFDAHMKLHAHRHCHLCGKDFKRKQNADIHLMGVHGFTKEDLVAQGR